MNRMIPDIDALEEPPQDEETNERDEMEIYVERDENRIKTCRTSLAGDTPHSI